jgi:hypothetical protein
MVEYRLLLRTPGAIKLLQDFGSLTRPLQDRVLLLISAIAADGRRRDIEPGIRFDRDET